MLKMSKRSCKNSPDVFCYICGELTFIKYRRNLTEHVKKLYRAYFGCKAGDQDKNWAPHSCCVRCSSALSLWFKGSGPGLPFGVPMIWREQHDHSSDCYFCLTDTKGYNTKNKDCIKYPNLPSAIRPVSHSAEIPVPTAPVTLPSNESDSSDSCDTECSEFQPECQKESIRCFTLHLH